MPVQHKPPGSFDYWDYRCRWEEPATGWIVIDVRVDRGGVVERSVG